MGKITHGSLFSGIGGFDLAAEWMGWENIFHCEWNPFGQKILKHYWPKAITYADITKTDFIIHRGKIDVLTGGFPCQPYSLAGKRKGKADERHLWPEMLRAIHEIKPTYIVGENVLGLVNWDGGLVFNEVQTNLEAAGYEVQPFVLPACGKNAPHKRERIWFIAHTNNAGSHNTMRNNGQGPQINNGWNGQPQPKLGQDGGNGIIANPEGSRARGLPNEGSEERAPYSNELSGKCSGVYGYGYAANPDSARRQKFNTANISTEPQQLTWLLNEEWANFPTQPPICNGNDGISTGLDTITFSKWRNESIKAGGNAVVPQVVMEIFKPIDYLLKHDPKN